MENKIFVLGYLSDKEDDGEALYTNVKIFKTEDDFRNYLWDNEGMTKKQIETFMTSETSVISKWGNRLVFWSQDFDK